MGSLFTKELKITMSYCMEQSCHINLNKSLIIFRQLVKS